MNKLWITLLGVLVASLALAGWNYPHAHPRNKSIRYVPLVSAPKTLDPAVAYSSGEINIMAQIIEPVLEYHRDKMPYQLEALTAAKPIQVRYFNAKHQPVAPDVSADAVAYTLYDITIKPGVYYQNHPGFARNQEGRFLYHTLTAKTFAGFKHLSGFPHSATRELVAADYIYQIKRLADPALNVPIYGIMKKYIDGLSRVSATIAALRMTKGADFFIDLRTLDLPAVKLIDKYHFQIRLNGKYPQFIYWLAMSFFAPTPWEIDRFYAQTILRRNNISWREYPVGTGPYQLTENNPNKELVLSVNKNYRRSATVDGQPSIKKVIFVLEKEGIPRWNKFLQGYYDLSGVGAESFDQAIKIDADGDPVLTPAMQKKGLQLQAVVEPGISYMGFNMLDSVVGGYTEKKAKLRRAIAMALDYKEYIAIFLNGRGVLAQGPIPPGIFGYRSEKEKINTYAYQRVNGRLSQYDIHHARALLAEAGYANGVDPKTGHALLLHYDVASTGSPDDKAFFHWMSEQFAKLGIQLDIRATLYNRFQEKVRAGKVQIFSWGWMADYPDPENFLFLLYGPNAKSPHGGENATNYQNPAVDRLFEKIRAVKNGPERQHLIDKMVAILQKDSPWIWGFHPVSYRLIHLWNSGVTANPMARNTLKHQVIDAGRRVQLQLHWNRPIFWPFFLFVLLFFLIIFPALWVYRKRLHSPSVVRVKKEGDTEC